MIPQPLTLSDQQALRVAGLLSTAPIKKLPPAPMDGVRFCAGCAEELDDKHRTYCSRACQHAPKTTVEDILAAEAEFTRRHAGGELR
ncbi:hypothetical protein ACTXKH_04475 [Brachybacterium tyrofermentans]|uniref:hypothetical protein n=1 Tax=Brachybacterium tyrofermentans TaxID=47848 RepID=UPI003F9003DC